MKVKKTHSEAETATEYYRYRSLRLLSNKSKFFIRKKNASD